MEIVYIVKRGEELDCFTDQSLAEQWANRYKTEVLEEVIIGKSELFEMMIAEEP